MSYNLCIRSVVRCVALTSLLCSSSHIFAAIEKSKQALPLHYAGRVLVDEKNQAYTYSWPGVYFEARFTGSELDIKLDDANNFLNVLVDNKNVALLKQPGKTIYSLTNLGSGEHTVRLEKRTETQMGTGTFEGFYIPATNKVLNPIIPKRKIEFIGDSLTVGYGNTSTSRECDDQKIFSSTDTQLAFGPLTAKYFNADYQINASSGFGVVRNYNGRFPNESLIKLYPYTLNDHNAMYTNNWSPNIIIIGLGTNDFSTPLNVGEKWKTREELGKDYETNYEAFIQTLHTKHKNASIIVFGPDDVDNEQTIHQKQVITRIQASGFRKINFLGVKPLERTACQWHPSLKDNTAISEQFIQYINAHPDLWN